MNDREAIIFDNLYRRRSIRYYKQDQPVEKEKIIKLLQGAMAAPSACNLQPWEFIVVTAPHKVQAIKESIEKYGDYNAPMMIVVCGYTELIPWEGLEWLMDCSAAIENMMLAAVPLGLGTVWIGGSKPEAIRPILDIPDDVYPMGIVYIGYPNHKPEPRTQFRQEAIHWESYDRTREHGPAPGNIFGLK